MQNSTYCITKDCQKTVTKDCLTCRWNWRAGSEGVTPISFQAEAHRNVVVHPAFGTEAADARARIHALVALTGLGAVTFGIHHALRTAALVRIAKVLWYAAAHSDIVVYAALSVCATFAGVAGILRRPWDFGC